MEITVDANLCIGSGHCVLTEPDVFDQDTEGVVLLLNRHPHPQHRAAAADAAERCPVGAITVTGGQQP
jgi:ferredoxin